MNDENNIAGTEILDEVFNPLDDTESLVEEFDTEQAEMETLTEQSELVGVVKEMQADVRVILTIVVLAFVLGCFRAWRFNYTKGVGL